MVESPWAFGLFPAPQGFRLREELFYRFSVGRVFVLRNPNWEFWDIGCFRSWSKDASPVCICFRLKFSHPDVKPYNLNL